MVDLGARRTPRLMDAVAGIGFDLDHTLEIDNKLERVAFMRLLELVEEHGGTRDCEFERRERSYRRALAAK